jgi:hypothetical protein
VQPRREHVAVELSDRLRRLVRRIKMDHAAMRQVLDYREGLVFCCRQSRNHLGNFRTVPYRAENVIRGLIDYRDAAATERIEQRPMRIIEANLYGLRIPRP